MLICDIDGCLFDNELRRNLIPSDKSKADNWTKFNKACLSDSPILPLIFFVKHHAKMQDGDDHRKITFVTARGENTRNETVEQLQKHFSNFKYDLFMRPMSDNRSAVDYKRDVFWSLSDNILSHSLIIDDNPGIINMVKVNFPQANRVLVTSFDCTLNGDDQCA